MSSMLLCSQRHPAVSALSACVDHVGPLSPSPLPEGVRSVVVLADNPTESMVSGLVDTLSAHAGLRVLVVCPGFAPASERAEAVRRLVHQLGADALLHAPLAENLLLASDDVSSRGELMLGVEPAAIPWVAAADLAQQVARWQAGAWHGERELAGPEDLDGEQLADMVSAMLNRLLQPETFIARRFWAMDADGNGVVETHEAIDYMVKLGLPPEMATDMVGQADRDADGTIDVAEFVHDLWTVLHAALSASHRHITCVPVPEPLLRDRWVRAGLTFGEATALLAHMARGALSPGAERGSTTVQMVFEAHALRFVPVHILPGRGVLIRRNGRFGDDNPGAPTLLWTDEDPQLMAESVLAQKVLPDGQVLSSRRAVRAGAVELRWVGDGPREVLCFGEGDAARAMELEEGCLVGLASRGPWPHLSDMVGDLVARRPLRSWELALFREQGSIRLEHLDTLADPTDIICHCVGVQRGALEAACGREGATLQSVTEATGVTRVCGGCAPLVEEVVGSSRLEVAEILENTDLGGGIYRLRIVPVRGQPAPSLPGQHIVLQGRVGGRWVTRAYTLTSPGGQSIPYEITIKREEMGVFSRWLADYAGTSGLIRCSAPCGDIFVGPEHPGPVYLFAGGIGITPGLAVARTLATDGSGRPVHIHWSARHPSDFLFADELDQLSDAGVSWTRRCTSREGRIDGATLRAQYLWQEGAVALVCGPAGYAEQISEGLVEAGWPPSAVRVETFSSRVNDEGEVQPSAGVVRTASASVEQIQTDTFFIDLRQGRAVMQEAMVFLRQMYTEKGLEGVLEARLTDVRAEVEATGTYTLSRDELAYGAQLAWRNSTRCIGRFFWQHLQVRDMRHLETEEEMFQSVVEHMRLATNGGDLISTLTVFRAGEPTVRMWNDQLIRYAGYRQPDGSVVGDPANCDLTERIQALGWEGLGGRFDVLPLVFQIGDRPPKWFALPDDAVLEVPLEHPSFPWFAELGLRWYALPAVSSVALDVGGVLHRCVPFNGFYMVTEIGARNLSDADRYNLLPVVAEKMGLDCSRSSTLWKDRALVELNVAVMHSFQKHRVRMLDHHAMSDYFHAFEQQEQKCGRAVYGDWSWLVPPLSGSLSGIFFRDDLKNVVLKPMFQYQHPVYVGDRPGPTHEGPVPPCPYHSRG